MTHTEPSTTSAAGRTPEPISGLEELLLTSWHAFCGDIPPPEGWAADLHDAITSHLIKERSEEIRLPPDRTREAEHHEIQRWQSSYGELMHTVREQLLDAVHKGTAGLAVANTILQNAGIPPISRAWTVHAQVPLTLQVIAPSEQAAYRTAEELISENTSDACRLEMNWRRSDMSAHPGELIR